MNKFQDRLLTDLLTEYQPTLDALHRQATPERRGANRPLWIAAGVLGLTGAITVGLVAFGGGTPAFAVTEDDKGDVTVTLRDESGIDGANEELRKRGMPAVVVPVRPGCVDIGTLPVDTGPGGKGRGRGPVTAEATTADNGSVTFSARNVPPGNTAVVTVEKSPPGKLVLSMTLVKGTPPNCVSLPTPGPGQGETHEESRDDGKPRLNSNGG
jgi:hypothetical protein